MFTCKIENAKNNVLELTQNEDDFQIIKITGLNPPNAQINRATIVGLDGSRINSSKLEERNIVITLKLNSDIEKNRIKLYSYFNTKQKCKLYYQNNSRDVYIEGYIENVECDLFTNNEIMQISIICPNPYFKALDEIVTDVSKVLGEFEFPFAIGSKGATNPNTTIDVVTDNAIPFSTIDIAKVTNVINNSESEIGVIINVEFTKNINELLIKNTDTGETFTLIYSFIEGDLLIIDTNKGSKLIKLIRNGNETNIFSSLQRGSTFFQLTIGDNYFSYLADGELGDEGVHIIFKRCIIYGGV